jgi:hypothetical protein
MVRVAALRCVGFFQHESLPGEDWDMWLRIAAHYDQGYIPQSLAYYRVHRTSITANYTLSSFLKSHLHTVRTLFARQDLPYPQQEKLAYACLDRTTALVAARLRHRGPFVRYLNRALRSQPHLFLEAETWVTLYEGCKLLVPSLALEAVGRLRARVLNGFGQPVLIDARFITGAAGGFPAPQSPIRDPWRGEGRVGASDLLVQRRQEVPGVDSDAP